MRGRSPAYESSAGESAVHGEPRGGATRDEVAPPESGGTMREQQIRALMIGAHPDDCEFTSGGLAAKLVARGHAVKFVSATNGEAGHHKIGGGPLAQRR